MNRTLWFLVIFGFLLVCASVAFAEEVNINDGKTYDAVAVRFSALTGERMSSVIVVKPGLTLAQCNQFTLDAGATTPINGEYVLVGCMERSDESKT